MISIPSFLQKEKKSVERKKERNNQYNKDEVVSNIPMINNTL